MKDTKYIFMDTACFDYHRLQEKLTRLAASGWHLEKPGNFTWKFRRGEPKAVRYEIIFSPAASAFNSRPTEAEEDLADLCAQAGWERVGTLAQLQVFRNENPNATPLETDEEQKLQNIQRTMRKHFLPQQVLMIVLFLLQFLMHGSTALMHPTRTLSSGLMVTTLVMLLWVVATYAVLLISSLLWLRKARLAVDAGQTIPHYHFYRRFRWVIWGMLVVYLLMLLLTVEPLFTLWVLVISALLIGTTFAMIALCKHMNAPRWVNIAVPVAVGSLVMMGATFVLIMTMDNLSLGLDLPTDVPLPLTLTQLTGETGTERTTLEAQSSPLVSYARCWDEGSEERISYTIVDIHCPLFYDMILNEQEQSFRQIAGWLPDATITYGNRDLFDAEYIRRCISGGYDRWFICWDDRVVSLKTSWELTEEQLALLVDALKP